MGQTPCYCQRGTRLNATKKSFVFAAYGTNPMLLPSGNPMKCHEEEFCLCSLWDKPHAITIGEPDEMPRRRVLSLQPMGQTPCYYHRGTRLNAMKKSFVFAAYGTNPMLLPSGNPIKCHEEEFCLCSLWDKRFDIFPPLFGGCSEGLDSLNNSVDT